MVELAGQLAVTGVVLFIVLVAIGALWDFDIPDTDFRWIVSILLLPTAIYIILKTWVS